MDALRYYIKDRITLDDLKKCLHKVGYQGDVANDPVLDEPFLYIPFHPKMSSQINAYWRWVWSDLQWTDIDIEEQAVISSIWSEISLVVSIWYPMIYMEDFGDMMFEVMQCFGGYVYFEGRLFNQSNILSIQDFMPQPPVEL